MCSVGDNEYFVAIVSDGAGSAEYGGEGAALVCRCFGLAVRQHFSVGRELPTRAAMECWIDEVRDRIYCAASSRGKSARDFAATLVCVISDGSKSILAHVGDGCVVLRERFTGNWVAATWPDHGEYASTTTFVTDQPVANLRVSTIQTEVDVIFAFSDGIERMVLDMATQKPFEGFFSVMSKPIIASQITHGRDGALSQQLRSYLDSEPVNARTDDDKTLVIAALR